MRIKLPSRIARLIGVVGFTLATAYSNAGPSNALPRSGFDCTTIIEIPQTECDALVALYDATDGSNWSRHDNWLTTNAPCNWFGITCTFGHVSWIDLSSNQLSGTLPSQLGNLTDLNYLILEQNQIGGQIPIELGSLAHLYILALGSNQLTGEIPSQLGNLSSPNLLMIGLGDNQLSGSIPPELASTNARSISLSNNQLTGTIPAELGNMPFLRWLILDYNQLSGSIPTQLGNLNLIITLGLSNNQLSGSIPPELGNLADLQTLRLNNNQFTASVPVELGSLHQLDELLLSDNPLSGAVPQELTQLSLHSLWFNNTNLCEPNNSAFQTWLASIYDLRRTNVLCPTTDDIDLWVTTPALFGIASGGVSPIYFDYGNYGSTAAASVTLTITLPSTLTYVSGIPEPNSIIGDEIIWSLPDLEFGTTRRVVSVVQAPVAPIGTRYPVSATVSSAGSEAFPVNNETDTEIMVALQFFLPILYK